MTVAAHLGDLCMGVVVIDCFRRSDLLRSGIISTHPVQTPSSSIKSMKIHTAARARSNASSASAMKSSIELYTATNVNDR